MTMPNVTAPLRKAIVHIFTRKYNLQLHTSALEFIHHVLDDHHLLNDEDEWDEAIEELAKGFINGDQHTDSSQGKTNAGTERPLL